MRTVNFREGHPGRTPSFFRFSRLLLMAMVALGLCTVTSDARSLGTEWCRESAQKQCLVESCKSGRETVMVFGAEWCGWCKQFDEKTLSDPEVRRRLRPYSLVYVDLDAAHDVAERFDVKSVPQTVMLDRSCQEKGRLRDAQPPNVFLRFLDDMAKKR